MLAAAIAVKWWYRSATVEDLGFMLRPVSALLEWTSGSPSTYSAGSGYAFHDLGIRIDRSCSGINFLIIATASFTLLFIRHATSGRARPLLILLALPMAYVLALLANASRILCCVAAKPTGLLAAPRAHEAFGAFVFLGFLLLAVTLLHRALPRHTA